MPSPGPLPSGSRSHRQLRGLQRRRWRRGPGQPRRWPSTRWPCAAWRGRPRPRARRSCTTARTSSSTAIAREPHGEDVRPSPRGVYASSKLLGEWFALEAPRAYVLRVESLFGSPAGWTGRRGTLDHIVDGIQQGREVRVFTDRIVSPSYSKDVAEATRHLVTSGGANGSLSLRQRRACELARGRQRGGSDPRHRASAGADHRGPDAAQGSAPTLLRALDQEAGGNRVRDADLARRAAAMAGAGRGIE